jgi:hypothetical protein
MDPPLMGPVLPAIIALIAGPLAAGPVAGRLLYRLGYRGWGWLAGVLLVLSGAALDVGLFLWRIEPYWCTLSLLAAHGVCAGILLLCLSRLSNHGRQAAPAARPMRGSYRQILTGIITGGLFSIVWGIAAVSLYMLASDRLLSTLMPVAFDDAASLFMLGMTFFPMLTAGLIAGGVLGWQRPASSPAAILGFALALLWVQLTWLASLQIAIAVPGFQAGAATGLGWRAIMVPFTVGQLIVGIGWSIALLLYVIQPPSLNAKCRHALGVPAIHLCAAVALAIVLGYPADGFLAMGRYQERRAHISSALWCYQRGLTKNPKPHIASYLQYRVALIHHKLGQPDKASSGFRRVVTKYNQRQELVHKAERFLDNLQHAGPADRRVVLPGVETHTQYTNAYCVPNSLALVMRYWDAPVDARRIGAKITGLGTGTYTVDQSWYALQHDFRHDFLPMAGLSDIKTCIDAGFPVLVYVPAHVFAIVGYDERLKTVVTYDVATRDVWTEYLQDDFIKAWKRQITTLVLAYPPEKAGRLPEAIRTRLRQGSDRYLHFQLYYLDTLAHTPGIAHLEKAAGENAAFFFPLTVLYTEFPSLRDTLNRRYDAERVSEAIIRYFGDNYDEGTHLAGQYHDERWAYPDGSLRSSVEYLIDQNRFDQLEQLLARVDTHGQLSGQMQYYNAILALSQGRYEAGLDRFSRASGHGTDFYAGLASLKVNDRPHALQGLVRTLDDCL